jgi:putative SOS response-associated peptidase YedK
MRRSLVLTDESARHWFRASLPPHVKRDLTPVPADPLWRLTAEDVRGFASVYVAATAALLVFIM